jgi:hypothetical protein
MKAATVEGLGVQVSGSREAILKELKRNFPDAQSIELVTHIQPKMTSAADILNGILEAVNALGFTQDDVIILTGAMYQSVLRDYLAQRGVLGKTLPHLTQMIGDGGGHLYRINPVRLIYTAQDVYPLEEKR